MANQDPVDLSALIEAAAKQSRDARAAAERQARPSRLARALSFARPLGLLAVATILVLVWHRFSPPGAEQVRQDLGQVLEQARQSVEAGRGADGSLPPALPDAALAAAVRYEPGDGVYRLEATVLDIRVVVEH